MKLFKFIFIPILLFPLWSNAHAEDLSVNAAVEKQNVFVGESFAFQVQVQGDESPQNPDISQIKEFHLVPRGGRQNSSQSVTIINGQVNRISKRGYIFNYSLTPKREGKLIIPSIAVVVGGRSLLTKPIVIVASKPQETDDFKLRMHLSKNKCYVGEPVEMTVNWYIGKDVEEFSFSLPHQEDSRFTVISPDVKQFSGQQNIVKIPVGQQALYAKKERGVLEGREYLTVQFNQTLIANETGQFIIPRATVSSKVLQGYSRGRSNDPFEGFFGRNRRGVYSTVITPSNEPKIQVLPLPKKGQPADFNGLVGSYSIFAQASPQEVNVGDPITLTIMVTGPKYLGNVTLPPLRSNQKLKSDFKIPDEMAPGEIKGRKKVFTQTIRAQHAAVKAIPAMSLSFFNTKTKVYETAHSEPIPLQVHQTKVVTVMDAEGEDVVMSNKKDIRALKQGIAQNFEDFSILENREYDRVEKLMPLSWLLLILIPPGLFLLVVGTTLIVARSKQDPKARLAKKALYNFMRSLKALEKETSLSYLTLSEVIRAYLGDKLSLPSKAITFQDVKGTLLTHKVPSETINNLQKIMDTCEEHRYAGGAVLQVEIDSDLKRVKDIISQIERSLS